MNLKKYSKSISLLILANLIPLLGVLFWDWSLSLVMILFWSENLVIGFYTVLKMKKSEMSTDIHPTLLQKLRGTLSGNISAASVKTKPELIKFFLGHFGTFTIGHGLFLLVILFVVFVEKFNASIEFGFLIPNLIFGIIGLVLSHGMSYKFNFVERKEYEVTSAQELFLQPYGRVTIMHLTILFGMFFVAALNSPVQLLIFLIVLKIILDIHAHIKEHSELAKRIDKLPTHDTI